MELPEPASVVIEISIFPVDAEGVTVASEVVTRMLAGLALEGVCSVVSMKPDYGEELEDEESDCDDNTP